VNEKYLHIITHDVPYPADFGGVVDIFYKIKWLHKVGVKIHLHCFVKDRPAQIALEEYCETVTYYKRKGFTSLSFYIPYIVSSRKSKLLLQNLQKDNYPILFEGIHSTYHLYYHAFENRKTLLRLFNVEYVYYNHLAKYEGDFFKKIYYLQEARLLKKYEATIANKVSILTLSKQDATIYKDIFKVQNIHFVPAFLPYDTLLSHTGVGSYCLYHANLSVNENEKAALWLVQTVFSEIKIPLIIAGKKPSSTLKNICAKYTNVSIVDSPTEQNMQLLITNAQINILPSFNNTGVKLKLLNALYNGRHCLANLAGVDGSGLNEHCNIAETASAFIEKIEQLFVEPFSEKEMQHRSTALKKIYNNEANALFILELLY
jgi:glycosyltransferase involved in cell wall biosynthesis